MYICIYVYNIYIYIYIYMYIYIYKYVCVCVCVCVDRFEPHSQRVNRRIVRERLREFVCKVRTASVRRGNN